MALDHEYHNYLDLVVMMKPLGTWLRPIRHLRSERNRIAWELIHICLSLHHLFCYHMSTDYVDMFCDVLGSYDPDILNELGFSFFFCLYHTVVGRYGHLHHSKTYVETIRASIRQSVYGRQPHELILIPDESKDDIPHPNTPPPDCQPTTTPTPPAGSAQ